MGRLREQNIYKDAFKELESKESCVDNRLGRKVKDCILDYIPAAKEYGLNYTPITFGLVRKGDGLSIRAYSNEIEMMFSNGLEINDDTYQSVDGILIAGEMNRIFGNMKKGL
jgi:hypothetical protein